MLLNHGRDPEGPSSQSRTVALLGLLLAINQIFIVLAAVLDISSLTMLAIAAMMIGIAILETSLASGAAFFTASCLLGLILCPIKLYILSYAVMGLYVLLKELLERKLRHRMSKWLLLLVKLACFNAYFVPLLLLVPGILLEAGEGKQMLIVVWALTQAAVVLCDYLYDRILVLYQSRIRRFFKK